MEPKSSCLQSKHFPNRAVSLAPLLYEVSPLTPGTEDYGRHRAMKERRGEASPRGWCKQGKGRDILSVSSLTGNLAKPS